MDRLMVVSADGHWGAPVAVYRDYLDAEYREDLDALVAVDEAWRESSPTQRRFTSETLELIDPDGTVRSGGEVGGWELDRRLVELDRQGVAGEVLLPGHQDAILPFFGQTSPASSPDHRAAGARAYHRHLAEAIAGSGGRLAGVAEPGPCVDMAATVAELRWAAAHGFVGVSPPGNTADPSLPPLYDPFFEPFWATCADAGLALVVHAGFGFPQGMADGMSMMSAMSASMTVEDMLRMATLSDEQMSTMRIDEFPTDHPFRIALTQPRRVLWQLMLAGVFDRYPSLTLVFTEIRADWVPTTLDILDRHFAEVGGAMELSPREYWERNVYMAPSSTRRPEVALRHEVGLHRFMFGTDYPHPEGTWPNTLDWIRDAFAGVPEAEARLILGENCVECYGLDGAALAAVAAHVGPATADVLGTHTVDERLLAQFHSRAGYLRPPEHVDESTYRDMFTEDEAGLAALGS
jgi:predicted TIM-barrel fold metal-dependent hydrolase